MLGGHHGWPDRGSVVDGGNASANPLEKIGSRKRVLRVWQSGGLSGAGGHAEFTQFRRTDLRQRIWLHSAEYPAPPPEGLCVVGRGFLGRKRPRLLPLRGLSLLAQAVA